MLVFATADDYARVTGSPPPDTFPARVLVATRWVKAACIADIFDTLPNGLPADDDKREALTVATCLQVQAWDALGVDPIAGVAALPATVTASGIDGATVTRNTAAQDQARIDAVTVLCGSARQALTEAGLATSAVVSW